MIHGSSEVELPAGEDVLSALDNGIPVVLADVNRALQCSCGATGESDDLTMSPTSDSDCVFCNIVSGTFESSRVYEDDDLLAFMDIQPVNPGHVLVIPKVHAPFLEDLDAEVGADVFRLADRIARALRRSGLSCDGVNLFLADGEAAFQEVFHVHLHVFPRTVGDAFRLEADWRTRERDELDESARHVRDGVAQL